MIKLIKKIFPSYNEKEILRYQNIVEKINGTEKNFSSVDEKFLQEKTNFFKEELKN